MQSPEKERYKDYLVRKVTEEIGNIFSIKMDEAKKELKDINYRSVLEKTEEILKNYNKLEKHVALTDEEKLELINESNAYHNKQIENIMTSLFSEDEIYLESLLKSKKKTKMFLDFINRVFNEYLSLKTNDKIEIRKRKILTELYIKGMKQSEFIYRFYEVDRTFYSDKDRLIKDLAPYFFGIKGLNI